MSISKEQVLGHLKDYKGLEAKCRATILQHEHMLEQIYGSMWYIENVLIPSFENDDVDGNGKVGVDTIFTDSPPRSELVE